jgi:hypothetical protein
MVELTILQSHAGDVPTGQTAHFMLRELEWLLA